MKFKKLFAAMVATAMLVSGCASNSQPPAASSNATPAPAEASGFSVAMVTDVGGVNDESFNQSSWEGLQLFKADTGAAAKYLESKQEADYLSHLDKLADEDQDLIWGVGYMMADAIKTAAQQNSDGMYAIIDNAYAPEDGTNLIGVVFKAQEPSFLAGYMAAKTTQTDKLGFIGGYVGEVIDQFEYGYRAGVAYAAKEMGKTIEVDVQYADSFTDDAKGKAIATQMYTNGCDIIFAAAGNVGKGMFEAAKEFDKLCIGVDRDQSDLAPNNTLTSAMKLVGQGMYLVSKDVMDGKASQLGGTTVVYGLAEGGVGLADSSIADPAVAADTKAIEPKIISGEIDVPYNEETFDAFLAAL